MEKALRVYGEVLRLVRRLPEDSRPYYAKYVRENFVNYREVDPGDAKAIEELFHGLQPLPLGPQQVFRGGICREQAQDYLLRRLDWLC